MTANERAWAEIETGAIIKAPSGRLRAVRRVSRPEHPERLRTRGHDGPNSCLLRRVHVWMTICRASWTGRPYTLYSVGELMGLGYTLTGRRIETDGDFGRLFLEDTESGRDGWQNFAPADVRGIG